MPKDNTELVAVPVDESYIIPRDDVDYNGRLSENENIAKAVKLAGKWMDDALAGKGRCPSSIVMHYIALDGASGEREAIRQNANNELLRRKAQQIKNQEDNNAGAAEAIEALYGYRGNK